MHSSVTDGKRRKKTFGFECETLSVALPTSLAKVEAVSENTDYRKMSISQNVLGSGRFQVISALNRNSLSHRAWVLESVVRRMCLVSCLQKHILLEIVIDSISDSCRSVGLDPNSYCPEKKKAKQTRNQVEFILGPMTLLKLLK